VRRFSLVPICSKRLFIVSFKSYISLVCWSSWFMCGSGQYLRHHKNFVWLFEHKLLLDECVMFIWFVQEECNVSNGDVGMVSFVGPCRLAGWFPPQRTHRTSLDLFSGIGLSNGHLRIWRISVWDGNNFRCVHIFYSFHIEQYPFCVREVRILFCTVHYIQYVLVIRTGFSSTKNMESGSLVLYWQKR
jgi:hypothetical protein